jgi:hypothetical protein
MHLFAVGPEPFAMRLMRCTVVRPIVKRRMFTHKRGMFRLESQPFLVGVVLGHVPG